MHDPSRGGPGEDLFATDRTSIVPPGVPFAVLPRGKLLLFPHAWAALIDEIATLLDPAVVCDSRTVWRRAAALALETVRDGLSLARVPVYRSVVAKWSNSAPALTSLTPVLFERFRGKRPLPLPEGNPLTGLLRVDAHGWGDP